MRIVYKDGKLDFGAPVFASESQREEIISYFKRNFPSIEIMEIKEDGKTFSERSRSEMKKWTKEEFVDLLRIGNLEELKKMTGRSDMSIKMKLGELMPELLSWARKNGYDSYIDEKKIKEFIEQRVKE